jgi:hypothetical protein
LTVTGGECPCEKTTNAEGKNEYVKKVTK